MTSRAYGAIGKRTQLILVLVRALGVENAFHSHRLGVKRIKPRAKDSLWCFNSRMLRITSIKGVS